MKERLEKTARIKKNVCRAVLTLAIMLFAFQSETIISLADSGKVVANSANIRSSADASSSVVGSAAKGVTVTIDGEQTDSSGMIWYQVTVDGKTGFIRSDLVDKTGEATGDVPQSTTSAPPTVETAGVTAMDAQGATVTSNDVRVRADASTSSGVVTTAANGTAVTVTGQKNGSDGKTWYQVTFISNGKDVTGFIRSDFVELGELIVPETPEVPVEETPVVEETIASSIPQPEIDYSLEYTSNEEGEYEWYLNNNTAGVRKKLNDLLNAVEEGNSNADKADATIGKQKIVIVVLAILVIVLAVVLVLVIFRMREGMYEDYEDEDDEDDEDEEEEQPARFRFNKRKFLRDEDDDDEEDEDEEEEQPVRRPAPRPQQPVRASQPAKVSQPAAPQPAARRPEPVKQAEAPKESAPRKSRNFLVEDDEFEFEFLNLDDRN